MILEAVRAPEGMRLGRRRFADGGPVRRLVDGEDWLVERSGAADVLAVATTSTSGESTGRGPRR